MLVSLLLTYDWLYLNCFDNLVYQEPKISSFFFSGIREVLHQDAQYMELFIRLLLPRNCCVGNLRSRHEQNIFLTTEFLISSIYFADLMLQLIEFHNSMQVVLTCTHTCLHSGRKPSPKQRQLSTTSVVVFIDFLPNTGYVYTCHVLVWNWFSMYVSRKKIAYLVNASRGEKKVYLVYVSRKNNCLSC